MKLSRYFPLVAALLATIVLGAITWLRPHWGMMDDASNIFSMVPSVQREGLFARAWSYGVADLGWGMFRPTYPPMAYLIYLPGMFTAPWVTFFWNALIVIALVWLYARVLAEVLRMPFYPLVFACAASFYAHDLLQHPSLQEKMILLSGACLTWLFWRRPQLPAWKFWPAALLVVAFGTCVKASFVIHYSAAWLALVGAYRAQLQRGQARAWAESLFFLALLFVVTGIFAYISKQGGYTQRYSFANVVPNLRSLDAIYFGAPLLLAGVFLARRWREVWTRPEILLPFVGVLAFLVVMLPWGIRGYIHAIIFPIHAALLVQLCLWCLAFLPEESWAVALAVLALFVTAYRSTVNFGRLGDIGEFLSSVPAFAEGLPVEVWMPSEEGSLSLQGFAEARKLPLQVHRMGLSEDPSGKAIFFDQAMAPFPGRPALPPNCQEPKEIWRGKWKGGYRLVKCR